eukprot:15178-Heterococcus_DN1.PRE.10
MPLKTLIAVVDVHVHVHTYPEPEANKSACRGSSCALQQCCLVSTSKHLASKVAAPIEHVDRVRTIARSTNKRSSGSSKQTTRSLSESQNSLCAVVVQGEERGEERRERGERERREIDDERVSSGVKQHQSTGSTGWIKSSRQQTASKQQSGVEQH